MLRQPSGNYAVADCAAKTIEPPEASLEYFVKPVPLRTEDPMKTYAVQAIGHLVRGEASHARRCLSAALAYSNSEKVEVPGIIYAVEERVARSEKNAKEIGRNLASAIKEFELRN